MYEIIQMVKHCSGASQLFPQYLFGRLNSSKAVFCAFKQGFTFHAEVSDQLRKPTAVSSGFLMHQRYLSASRHRRSEENLISATMLIFGKRVVLRCFMQLCDLFIYLFLQIQHSDLMGELGYCINFSIQLGTDLHPAATGQGRI